MNRAEYAEWAEDFTDRFPDAGSWLGKHPGTMDLWYRDVFSGFGIDDALEASKQFFSGKREVWTAYEREKIPQFYQAAVGQLRSDRRKQDDAYQRFNDKLWEDRCRRLGGTLEAADSVTDGPSMATAYRVVREMTEAGATRQEQLDYLDEYFGG